MYQFCSCTIYYDIIADENLGDRLYSSFEPAGEPGMRDHYIIGYIEKLDAEMESVDCFFPLWNDESWDNITFKLEMERKNCHKHTLIYSLSKDPVK